MMQTITFECEVVTPMFLTGADGSTPELRSPSIKGALRFWWRAMNGHLLLNEMREREALIFGSAEYGRSKVIIRVSEDMKWDSRTKASPTPHKPRFQKNAFREGQPFSVTLSLFKNDKFSYKEMMNLFLLTATLGGIGGRVRRGFGAFNIKRVIENGKILDLEQPKTINEIAKLLPDYYFTTIKNKIVSRNQRDNDYPYIKEIEIGSPNAEIIRKIGFTTHDVKGMDSYAYENSLGHASKGRFASPVYVSVIKKDRGLRPIITSLNTVNDKGRRVDYEMQHIFKGKIL